MRMDPFTSLSTLFLILLCVAALMVLLYKWSKSKAARRKLDQAIWEDHQKKLLETPADARMNAREAVARSMYGTAVGWNWAAMEDYDHSEKVRETWLREADIHLQFLRKFPQDQSTI